MTDGITEARSSGRTVHHVHVDIRGLLSSRRAIRGLVDTETGRALDDYAARARLLDLLAEGVRCLPIGTPCPGFSQTTGCPGHSE